MAGYRYTARIPDPRTPDREGATKPKIVIIGGGVAGLTVAHELSLTGRFEIEIIERQGAAGGKARTAWADGGFHEHSMRALLGSYVCIHQVLQEIMAEDGPLIQRIRPAIMTLRYGQRTHEFLSSYASWYWLLAYLWNVLGLARFLLQSGVKAHDLLIAIFKCLRFLTMRASQTAMETARLSFEDYVSDEQKSEGLEKVVFPVAEIFVAAKSYASATVVGRSLLEWFINPFLAGPYTTREFGEFDGPTSEAFIDPWVTWLTASGVRFRFDTTTTQIRVQYGHVAGITVQTQNGVDEEVGADAYVLAVQHNVAHAFLRDEVERYIPDLANFVRLGEEWAQSVQFLVDADNEQVVRQGRRFVGVLDSPWSIAYRIYSASTMRKGVWEKSGLPRNRAVLTATVSNCRRPGIVHGLPFLRCTTQQIVEEVVAQAGLSAVVLPNSASLGLGLELIDASQVDTRDPRYGGYGIAFVGQDNLVFRSEALMYIRLPGNSDIEPENATGIDNLFLTGEYTKTRFMIPTMEKSCESGKRCSHAILSAFAMPKSKDRVPDFGLPLAFLRGEFFQLTLRAIGALLILLAVAALAVVLRSAVR